MNTLAHTTAPDPRPAWPRSWPRLTVAALAAICLVEAASAEEAIDPTSLVKATLLTSASPIAPGSPFKAAVVLDIAPQWHIYWENPGDSGLATRVKLQAPEGFEISPLRFPGPNRYELSGGIINYGYDTQVVLWVDVTPPPTLAGAEVALQAEVKWLVCHDRCIPQKAVVSVTVPVAQVASPANEALIAPFEQRLPRPWSALAGASARLSADHSVTLSAPGCEALDFYPTAKMPFSYLGREVLKGGGAVQLRFKDQAAPDGVFKASCGGEVPSFFRLSPDVPLVNG